MQFELRCLVWQRFEAAALEVTLNFKFSKRKLLELASRKILILGELLKAWVLTSREARRKVRDKFGTGETVVIQLNLVSCSVVAINVAGIDNLLNALLDFLSVYCNGNHKVAVNCGLLIGRKGGRVELRHFVHVGEFSQSTEEVVSRDGSLTFEEAQPKYLGVLNSKVLADLLSEIIIHDVLEVDLVQVVGPRVQHGEALVVNALSAVLHDVISDKLKVGLVGLNWVL